MSPSGNFITVSEIAQEDLKSFRSKQGNMTTVKISDIMLQICLGLQHTHRKGMIHRDISPDNVLVFEDGEIIKISDFGIASFGT